MGAPSLPVDWPEIQRAAELGADLKALAARFGIDYETIRKRSYREQWLEPHRLQKRLSGAQALRKAVAVGEELSRYVANPPDTSLFREKGGDQKDRDRDNAEQALADTWEARGEQIRSQAWLIAQKSLKPAIEQGLMITTIKEANTAIEMARKATGQFQEQAMVSLSMYGESGSGFLQNVHDVASSPIVDMEDGDDWV